MNFLRFTSPRTHQHGISLLEVLIGLAIGLVCSLALFQTLTTWSSRTRSTSSGADAQTAGNLALYLMDKDFKLAGMGFGMATSEFAGCTIETNDAGFSPQMSAVTITQGATGAPDTLRVLYGNSTYMTSGQPFDGTTTTTKVARSRPGFNMGDYFIAAARSAGGTSYFCKLLVMTGSPPIATDDGKTLYHTASTTFNSYYDTAAVVSAPSNVTDSASWIGSGVTGFLFDLGPSPVLAEWRITAGVLQRANLLTIPRETGLITIPAVYAEVEQGIVNLQARYGYLNTTTNALDWLEPDALPTPTDWTRVRAIRLGMLIRNQHYEPVPVYTDGSNGVPLPSWDAGNADGTREAFVMTNADGTTDSSPANSPNNWRNYRYRVYETIIPLRNVIWGNSSTSAPAS